MRGGWLVWLAACEEQSPGSAVSTISFVAPDEIGVLVGTVDVVVVGESAEAVVVSVDAEPLGTCDATPCSLRWDTTLGVDGERQVIAIQSGDSGQPVSAARIVTVQNGAHRPDELRIVNPVDTTSVCDGSVLEARPTSEAELSASAATTELTATSESPWQWTVGAAGQTSDTLLVQATFLDEETLQRVLAITFADPCPGLPTASITFPEWNAAVNLDFVAMGVVGDAEHAAWFLDDALLGENTHEPWEIGLQTGSTMEGSHVLSVAAWGVAGGLTTTEVPFRVDRTAPTFGELPFETGDRLAGAYDLGIPIADALSDFTADVSVDGVGLCVWESTVTPCVWDSANATWGNHEVVWTASDEAGNTASVAANVIVDNPPTVALSHPLSGDLVAQNVQIDGTADDDEGQPVVSVRVDDTEIATALPADWDSCSVNDGDHIVTLMATDGSGQSAAQTATVRVEQAFEIELSSGSTLALGQALAVTTSSGEGALLAEFTLDGFEVGTSVGFDAAASCSLPCPQNCESTSILPDLSGFASGVVTLGVTVTDAAGRTRTGSTTIELLLDQDGDGFDDASIGGPDCDDTSVAVYPGAPEACDGLDQNCDGVVDEGFDADGDGSQDATFCLMGDDCDDTNPEIFPGATDVCDGLDNDCDGFTDTSAPPVVTDAEFSAADEPFELDESLVGNAYELSGDATLSEVSAFGRAATGGTLTLVLYETAEGDDVYWRLSEWTTSAATTAAWVTWTGLDYRMTGGRRYILAVETDRAGDAWGAEGPAFDVQGPLTPLGSYTSADSGEGDLVESALHTDVLYAQRLSVVERDAADLDDDDDGVTGWCGDCDDEDAERLPGLPESCDGRDNDCDGSIAGEADDDGDGFRVCDADCDDLDSATWPGADEICDAKDNDCDGASSGEEDADSDGFLACDGDCNDTDASIVPTVYYADIDEDSFGDPGSRTPSCTPISGWLTDGTDCDDSRTDVNPGAPEVCDGADNDCSGGTDEGFPDNDGDGWLECLDCDDSDASVSPDATEVRGNDIDDDCDGLNMQNQQSGTVSVSTGTKFSPGSGVSYFGNTVVGGQDLNEDGLDDVVMGATGSKGTGWVVTDSTSGAATVTLTGVTSSASTFYSMALPGDMDGDGHNEIVVGAPYSADGATYSGLVYILEGPFGDTPSLSLSSYESRLSGGSASLRAGYALDAAGDLTLDGHPDLLLGATHADSGSYSGATYASGAVYVIPDPGSGALNVGDAGFVLWGETSGSSYDQAGCGVAGVGDVDGDGQADVLVGGPESNIGGSDSGGVWLVLGPVLADASFADADARLAGERYEGIGCVLTGGGDTNGDGTADFAVGSIDSTEGGSGNDGAVYLFSEGVPAGDLVTGATVVVYATDSYYFGITVDLRGDVDADGYADLLSGDRYWNGAVSYGGAAFLTYGPMAGTLDASTKGVVFEGDSSRSYTGEAVCFGGDMDGDSGSEVVIGGDAYSSSRGAAWIMGSSP